MGLLDFIFKRNKKDLPLAKVFKFERVVSDYSVSIGDKVNLWNKPNSNQINLYASGSAAGRGLVGMIENSVLAFHLANTEYLCFESEIVGLSDNQIRVYIYMYTNKETRLKLENNQREKWIELILKNYKPNSTWELRFFSDTQIDLKMTRIKTINKDEVQEFYEKKDQAIWLVNEKQERVEAENRIRQGGTEKTLRAVFSGHKIIISDIKKDDNWYYINVGIENNAT